MELLFGVEPFYVLSYLVAGSIAASGVGWKLLKLIQKIDQRGQNQNKALIIISEHQDNETDRLHPRRSENHITETIRTVVKMDKDIPIFSKDRGYINKFVFIAEEGGKNGSK